MLHVRRDTLARVLRSHDEDELAERALSVTDDELKRLGELGERYAFAKRAMATGGRMGGARALSMATIDALEGTPRDLRWPRSESSATCGRTTYQCRVRQRPRAASPLSRRPAAPSTRLTWPLSRANRRRDWC
jgi:hypothetical protein